MISIFILILTLHFEINLINGVLMDSNLNIKRGFIIVAPPLYHHHQERSRLFQVGVQSRMEDSMNRFEVDPILQNHRVRKKEEYIRRKQIKKFQNNLLSRQVTTTTSTPATVETCVGFDNILNDLGILGLLLGIIAITVGIFSDLLSYFGVLQSAVSVLFGGGPSATIVIIERITSTVIPVPISYLVDTFTIIDKFVNIYINIPFAFVATVISSISNTLSTASLALGIFALFPKEVEEGFNNFFGKEFVKQYGCNNPYSNFTKYVTDYL